MLPDSNPPLHVGQDDPNMVQCPECGGKKKLLGFFPRYLPSVPRSERKPVIEMDCPCCNGTGVILSYRLAWMERGKAMRERRIDMRLGLRKAAEEWGVLPSTLCNMEAGRIEPVESVIPKTA